MNKGILLVWWISNDLTLGADDNAFQKKKTRRDFLLDS